jgi:hypothetical protein
MLDRAYSAPGHICRKSSSDVCRLSPEDTAGMEPLAVTDPDKREHLNQVSGYKIVHWTCLTAALKVVAASYMSAFRDP